MRLFKVFFPTRVVALLSSEIILIWACYLVAAYFTTDTPNSFLFDEGGMRRIGLATGCIVVGAYFSNLYSAPRIRSKTRLLQQVCVVLGSAFLIQSLLAYLSLPDWALPRWMMIYGSFLVLLVQPSWRILYDRVVIRRLAGERVLFLGTSPVARMVAERIAENPHFGMIVAGYLEDSPGSDKVPASLLLGPIGQLDKVVAELKPQRIIIGMTEGSGRLPVHSLLELHQAGIHLEDAQRAYETVYNRVSLEDLNASQLIFRPVLRGGRQWELWQGIYSFALALAGLVIASPVMLLIALWVRLTSPGPVFCRQMRAGRDGPNFALLRFRSEFQGRVTPLGRWLRRLRLDELPQLINVLRGDMAVVGPRPERPEFVKVLAEQIPYYLQRLAVKPGITGWAQVNHYSGDTAEDTLFKLEYDLYYVKNLNITLDLYILFQTVKMGMQSRGAREQD